MPDLPINDYGCKVKGQDQLWYDRWAFARRHPMDMGCPSRPELFKRIAKVLAPRHFEWHEWTQKTIDLLCHQKWAGLCGCAGSAKSYNAVGFACTWWLAAPEESSVILCSTTVKAMRRRAWAEVQRYYSNMPDRHGNFVDSRMLWQAVEGDDKHAIVGIAVQDGVVSKIADNIKGHHTRRQMVVIDEGTAIPPAIFDAASNLCGTPEEFILVIIFNPRSHLDQAGRFCEPKDGWNSISVETEEWETVPQLDGSTGMVVRFDATKSPNIKEGRLVSRHLPTQARVEARKKALGGENSPLFWSNERGFWAPDGLSKTVFTESAIISHGGFDRHTFTGRNFTIIGAFDPAFGGGDRPALRFGKLGELAEQGKWGLEWSNPFIVELNSASSNPIGYQLAEGVRRICDSFRWGDATYTCLPENLGIDATGAGATLCDIMQRTWSARIIRIQFGSSASEDSCSPEDIRPSNEVYRNKRAEMYFRAWDALNHHQLKGIDKDTAAELCTIEYDDSKSLIKIQDKAEYKEKFGKSPDLADSGIMLLEVARQKGFRLSLLGQTVVRHQDYEQQVKLTQQVYETVDYTEEEVEEFV